MLAPYNLPHLSYKQQAEKLASRGLDVGNPADTQRWLERVGYYRLRPYWNALIADTATGAFREGATFAYAVDLYLFDMRLRQCLLTGLERLEVALRVRVSHALGRRDPLAHTMPGCFDSRKVHLHGAWLEKSNAQLSESREEWLSEFHRQFKPPAPVWMAIEAWSFKIVSNLLAIMHQNDRATIAREFTVNPDTFVSWVRACVTVRNSCAHYNRLWNKPLVDQPAVPKTWEAKQLQHLSDTRLSETRIYAVIAVTTYMLGVVGSNDTWKTQMKELFAGFPTGTGLSLEASGFPSDWLTRPLWL